VSAVIAAESSLDLTRPFAVSNADDLYGRESFRSSESTGDERE